MYFRVDRQCQVSNGVITVARSFWAVSEAVVERLPKNIESHAFRERIFKVGQGLNAGSTFPRGVPGDVIQKTGQATIVADIPDYDGRVKNARSDIIDRSRIRIGYDRPPAIRRRLDGGEIIRVNAYHAPFIVCRQAWTWDRHRSRNDNYQAGPG